MERVRFNNCLNKETKYWNVPLGALIGCAFLGGMLVLFKGILWGFGGAASGFIIGTLVAKAWWQGNLQRFLYWNLPLSKILFTKRFPQSHMRVLM